MSSELNIRDEERLLIELCRLDFNEEHLKKIRLLVTEIKDWDYFRKLANAHGVTALAWNNLEKHNLNSSIPNDVAIILRGSLLQSLSRNTFNTESLSNALRLLNAENIKTVLLKGMALENSVYGNAGLRQMSDVDILISRADCIRARNILIHNGYESLPVKSFFHKLILADTGKHLPSLLKNGTSLEIHHELFGGKNRTLTSLFYDTGFEIKIKDETAWIPQPQIFFLYLVKHLYLHEMNNESQLRLYTDLVVLLEKHREEILNPDLIKLASESGMQEMLANHLEPLRIFWEIPFPALINDFISKNLNPSYLNKFLFFLKSPKDNPPADKSHFYRHVLADIPGLHRKILFVLGDIFPSVRFMKNRYKCSSTLKVLMYYPHRIGKLWWLIKR
ncbi:MAG: nucleotidyltransferase family protein [Bacteroidales bacterium]|nr:nucleotidyltransferase family protein [Bacteroidales bacterium]